MAEYIKREDVKTAIRKRFNSLADRVEINTIVNMMPHIDIVLCKECKYWIDNCDEDDDLFRECRWRDEEAPDDDDFCSYGERKESE